MYNRHRFAADISVATMCRLGIVHEAYEAYYMYDGHNTCTMATVYVMCAQYMYCDQNPCSVVIIHLGLWIMDYGPWTFEYMDDGAWIMAYGY